MSNEQSLSRIFGGGLFCNNGIFILLIIGAILLIGDDLIEWFFCDDMGIIWIVLLLLLLTNFDFDNGCGCC